MDLVKHDKRFEALKEELIENREKAQLFRTETEMRYSVLNDGSHPTKASKYWQCVREMNAMYETLIDDDYMYKKMLIEARIEDKKANEADDEDSLQKQLENRLATLTQGSGQADVLNVLGPLNTITDDYTNAITERKEHLKKTLKKKN